MKLNINNRFDLETWNLQGQGHRQRSQWIDLIKVYLHVKFEKRYCQWSFCNELTRNNRFDIETWNLQGQGHRQRSQWVELIKVYLHVKFERGIVNGHSAMNLNTRPNCWRRRTDGRHHFIDRILLRNAAKSQLLCYSEILLELCSILFKFYKNLQFPKFHSWLKDNFEEKSSVFTLNHPPRYSYSRLAWLYIHNRSFTGNLDGGDASQKPRGSCCGGWALMFWKFTIIYTIVNFTLLHKTLLHEKYLTQGILIFSKIILLSLKDVYFCFIDSLVHKLVKKK